MVLKDYVCCLKGKFEMAQKGDPAAASYLMKALSLKRYIFTIYSHEWHQEDWQDQPLRHRDEQSPI